MNPSKSVSDFFHKWVFIRSHWRNRAHTNLLRYSL